MNTLPSNVVQTKQQLNSAANKVISNEEFAELFSKFDIEGKVAVACSGGIDSLCLAYLTAKQSEIVALIIDHKLRDESESEAQKTSEILNKLNIENHILTEERQITSNIQAQARKLRYDLLVDYCKTNNIKTLLTAHHADDNAETVLIKLSRGSGVDGLCGIAEETNIDGIKIIRPLLSTPKSRLEETLQAANIEWVKDPTNQTDKYKRNKIRLTLAELEDAELITSRLNATAENMQRVRHYLESETDKAYENCISGDILNLDEFKKLHDEIAFRLLVKIIMTKTELEYRPRFEKIKSLKNAITSNRLKTLAGLEFRPQDDNFVITLENPS